MIRLTDDALDTLRDNVEFCIGNLQHPACTLEHAGRFYEDAAEALRAHAIALLLLHADRDGFSSSLVSSGHARRAFLRRCTQKQYADCFLAPSRSGSMFDAIAGDDLDLAAEIFRMSPTSFRKGDEYEDDFSWQRLVGLLLTGAPRAEIAAGLTALEAATEGTGSRLGLAKALIARDAEGFAEAFGSLLDDRATEIEDDDTTDEDVVAAAGAQVFIEGIAVLKLARQLGIPIEPEYPMCPTLVLVPGRPATPADEFSPP